MAEDQGEDQMSINSAFYGYPLPKKGPETAYVTKPGSNPVIRGTTLSVAGWAAASFNFVGNFLWANAGFSQLRTVTELQDFEPRYDPTVIPIVKEAGTSSPLKELNDLVEERAQTLSNRHHSVADYHFAFKGGELTPTAVAKTLLKLITSTPAHKVAFLTIKESRVLAAAEASTRRWQAGKALSVLDGIPVAVKDEVDLDGYEKSLGSSQDFTRPEGGTSWCVRKWEEAGAIIIGKLNMHELGLDTTNNNPVKGTPLNPYNPHYYTGGSSGGSAYAVSAGLLPITLGADGGGSIRIPSSFCGIYGLKPSHSRISMAPTTSLAYSCGVIGPLASNMADLEIAYRIMATPDPNHPSSSLFPASIPSGVPQRPNQKLLGIYHPWFDSADPRVLNLCHAALSHYRASGYSVIDITLPHLPLGQLAHAITILAELGGGNISLGGLSPANKILLSVAHQTPAADFLAAQKLRQLLMQHLAHLFRTHPGLLIVTPTTPLAGWPIAKGAADLARGCSDANSSLRNMEYVWLANFTGNPALSVPVGLAETAPKFDSARDDGDARVPVGLMAMGEWGGEDALFEWGRVAEKWAWRESSSEEGGGGMKRPGSWVDVVAAAQREGSGS
ncbi:hypothetical protein MMC22_010031 [Lobaria immixta]|nr:hypothetical protein [Lobaria immixta]